MIRLPPTSIDISQQDLNSHLQQLDIYQGLLKQGFKNKEIAKYFRDQNATLVEQVSGNEYADRTTFLGDQIISPKVCKRSTHVTLTTIDSSPDPLHLSQSPSTSQEASNPLKRDLETARVLIQRSVVEEQKHAPRQSSLLRFARAVSSDSSAEVSTSRVRKPFSPRGNITYRPRSQTYSYDQSEISESELENTFKTGLADFQHLSLDEDLVPISAESDKTVLHVGSSLRPEAESFTPLASLIKANSPTFQAEERTDHSSGSDDISLPSSPPSPVVRSSSRIRQRSPSLPRMVQTPPRSETRESVDTQKRVHQQYLDGSFVVYDDSISAEHQPQTPADLSQGRLIDAYTAAYTAPPGRIRSSVLPQGRYVHGLRQPSGDQSPTTRALLIRQRRRREFDRGARVEELRVNRMREGETHNYADGPNFTQNFWRDDYDADVVGEENFEDATLAGAVRRLRTMSGNRRELEG